MIKIEELTEKHLNQYVEFKNVSHKESKYINPTTIEKTKDLINEYKTDKDKIGFIILDNNKIIGQLFLKINRKDNLCHILLISVLQSYYGKDISNKLIDKAISFTKENNLSALELIVAKDNDRAISFYKKKSFKYVKDFSKVNYLYRLELNKENNSLKAIIIKGNPKYINNSLAKKYYKDIEDFLKNNGISIVEFDDGKEYTRPKLNADIYIAHSRGCSRYDFMPKDKQKVFLKFGVPEGIIDPIDLKWQQEVWTKDTDIQPPDEHFTLIPKQKEAILKLINQVKNVSLESITDYIDIPKEILDKAKVDPIIGTYITSDKPRIGIYDYNDRVVGFYSPFQEEYKGTTYWRTGNIYVLPEYRNKGLCTEALIEFFADKPYGMATIVFSNKASLKAFEKAGFRIDYNYYKLNPKGVQLYLLLKKPPEDLKPAFLSWK